MGMIDYESLSVTSATAVPISSALIDQHPNVAVITCETAPVRFRLDGTAPTTTEGHYLKVDDVLRLTFGELSGFQAIAVGTTATLKVSTGVG